MKGHLLLLLLGVALATDARSAPDATVAQVTPSQSQVRIKFNAYDGNPSVPAEMQFQINTPDLRQPTAFLKIGDQIPKTHLKLQKFAVKLERDPKTGAENDVSELTIVDQQTGALFVLPLNKAVYIPSAPARKAP